jgi:hypothetical protein
MKGTQHLIVNAGFLERLCTSEEVSTLLGDKKHLSELQSILPSNLKLELRFIPVIRSGGLFAALSKTALELLLVCIVFALSFIKRQEILFFSSYPSVKIFIEILSRIHPFKVFIVHHGELDGLAQSKDKRYTKLVRFYFSLRKSKKLTDVFLSDGIRDNALQLLGHKLPSCLSILHPFPTLLKPITPYVIEHIDQSKITIGYFGALTKENFPRVQNIIDALGRRVELLGKQDFNFLVVAPNSSKLNYGFLPCSAHVDTMCGLSHEEFSAQVTNLDIAIFPYSEKQYELSASGIVVDCKIQKIYFLAARSTFFTDWIDEHKGSGTLFDSFEELLLAIENSTLDFGT